MLILTGLIDCFTFAVVIVTFLGGGLIMLLFKNAFVLTYLRWGRGVAGSNSSLGRNFLHLPPSPQLLALQGGNHCVVLQVRQKNRFCLLQVSGVTGIFFVSLLNV